MIFSKNNACSYGRTQSNCVSRRFRLLQLLKLPTTAAGVRPGFIWYHEIWLMPSELLQLLKAFFRALLLNLCTLDGKEMANRTKWTSMRVLGQQYVDFWMVSDFNCWKNVRSEFWKTEKNGPKQFPSHYFEGGLKKSLDAAQHFRAVKWPNNRW